MRSIITIFFLFCSFSIFAQDAEVMVVNVYGSPVQLIVEDVATGQELATSTNIDNYGASAPLSTPVITILNLRIVNPSDNSPVMTVENVVMEEGQLRIVTIGKQGNVTQASSHVLSNTTPSSSTIRGNFRQLANTENIDVILEDGTLLAENLGDRDLSGFFSINVATNSNTLILNSTNNGDPIAAFNWNYDDALMGKWVYAFAHGEASDLGVFVVDLADGDVTELDQLWTTGVEDVIETPFTLSPNPSTDFIQIDMENIAPTSYQIYSIDGKLVKESKEWNSNKISIQDLPTGDYIIQLEQEGHRLSKQFSKY